MAPTKTKKLRKKTARKKEIEECSPKLLSSQDLVGLLAGTTSKKYTLHRNISSSGGYEIKSWRSVPRQLCRVDHKPHQPPQIVQISENRRQRHYDQYTNTWGWGTTRDHDYSTRRYIERGVAVEADSSGCFWETSKKYCRRRRPNVSFKSARLMKSHIYPFVVYTVSVTGTCSPAFVFTITNSWGGECSKEDHFTLKDGNQFGQHMEFTNVVAFQGKFYALSLQGSLVVVEVDDSYFRITGVGGNRAVPSKVCRHFRECLFVYDDEILLVFLVSNKCIGVVEDLEVFRLDIGKLLWVKVENLGQRLLFLADGRGGGGAIASEVGCRSNCIYFTNYPRVNGAAVNWVFFDLQTRLILPVSRV